MPRMPAEMYIAAVKQSRWHDKRRHVIGLINWRLARGIVFHPDEILAACRQLVSIKFVRATLEMVLDEGMAVRISGNRYGPSPKHAQGRRAMYLNLFDEKSEISPKEIYHAIPVPECRNDIRIMLTELEALGHIEKIRRGTYRKTSVSIKIAI